MKKRLLLLSLALLACLALSTPAWAADVATESALRTALESASTSKNAPTEIKLTADIQTTDYLEVKSGTYVTLDLNGHTIDRGLAGKEAVENGFVVGVQGSLTLKDSRSDGKITGGNNTGSGGGVYVEPSGSFMINGGIISGNTAKIGGGIENWAGEFHMEGGSINNNTAVSDGGGIDIFNGSLTMTGGTISNNVAKNGGGVYVFQGSFNMYGGTISGNTATTNGGGIFVFHSSYNVSGGKIINNLSGSSGGGGIAISDASTFIVGGTALVDTSNKAGNIEQVYGWATGATIVELSSQSDALNVL